MLIYLAARYSRFPEMQNVRGDLEKQEHMITSRWINGNHKISDSGLSDREAELMRLLFACEDLEDLEASDCVISFTEPPRSKASRGGRHVEFGLALAMRKRCIVVGPRENVFHCLPDVEWYPDYNSFIRNFKTVGAANGKS